MGETATIGQPEYLWHYTFTQFRDIVDTLRVTMNLHSPIERTAMLENLRGEIYDNLNVFVENTPRGPKFAPHWIRELRETINLSAKDTRLGSVIALSPRSSRGLWEFLMAIPPQEQFATRATQRAILSGQFLSYDSLHTKLKATNAHQIMQKLVAEVERYRSVRVTIDDAKPALLAHLASAAKGSVEGHIEGFILATALVLADRLENILQLSAALLRYINHPSEDAPSPALLPVSPLTDQLEGLEQARLTPEQIQNWLDWSQYGIDQSIERSAVIR